MYIYIIYIRRKRELGERNRAWNSNLCPILQFPEPFVSIHSLPIKGSFLFFLGFPFFIFFSLFLWISFNDLWQVKIKAKWESHLLLSGRNAPRIPLRFSSLSLLIQSCSKLFYLPVFFQWIFVFASFRVRFPFLV